MTEAFKEYKTLERIREKLIEAGMNPMDRVIDKISRRECNLLKEMTQDEFEAAMFEDNIYFW